MTVKEASVIFKLDETEIRKRINQDMVIGSTKDKRKFVIPDTTKIIPSKQEIRSFLFQILKYKNNNSYIVSRELCPDDIRLEVLMEYLYLRGFIDSCICSNGIKSAFEEIKLTDRGLNYILDANSNKKLDPHIALPIALNVNIGLVNASVG